MPLVAVCSSDRRVFGIPAGKRARIELLDREIVGYLDRGGMVRARQLRAPGVHQLLEDRGCVVLGSVDQEPSRRVPASAFERGAAPVIDRIAALGETVDGGHATAATGSNGEAVLELPEQRLDPAGAEVGGRKIEGGLVVELRVRGGEKPLRLLRRLPHLLRQRGKAGDPLQPLAFGRPEPSFSRPPLERERAVMLDPHDVARAVLLCASLQKGAMIPELQICPTFMRDTSADIETARWVGAPDDTPDKPEK